MHFSVLERTESDLSKINWLCGVILLLPIVLVPWGQVSIVSHSYQTYFGFPGSDLILRCGLRDHEVRIRWYTRSYHSVIFMLLLSVPSTFPVFSFISLFFVSASSNKKERGYISPFSVPSIQYLKGGAD